MTGSPYPASAIERVRRVEDRQDGSERVISGLMTTVAVHGEQIDGIRDDIRALDCRITSILKALWSLVLVLIPVGVGLIALAFQGG